MLIMNEVTVCVMNKVDNRSKKAAMGKVVNENSQHELYIIYALLMYNYCTCL